MPAITVDGQSFSLDGHRLWLVSGTMPYFRVPHQLWAERLSAAAQAGLNCVETPIPWNLHEPRPGTFKFDGDLDLHSFVRMAGHHRLRCILRMGPYVGEGMDMGGLPTWLLPEAASKLRSSAPEFIQSCSKFLAALCDRVRDLQANYGRKGGGPVIAVQNEHQWLCGDESQGQAYLGELNRFLREHGITVPILGAHNLFYSVEGEVDAWVGSRNLHANMRQLREVRPDQARIIIGLDVVAPAIWGNPAPEPLDARVVMRRLAEALAAGAQYNLSPFHAGTSFGFTGGRLGTAPDAFVATDSAPGAPLMEDGRRGPLCDPIRRISTFASQFGRVLASLDPGYLPAMLSLDGHSVGSAKNGKRSALDPATGGIVVIERRGSQGSILFVFAPEHDGASPSRGLVLLGDGSSLPFDLGDQPVGWMLVGAHLVGRATLDYCNLCVFAIVGSVLVCYGPARAPGVMSINGSAFEMVVPDGQSALVEQHEGVTIVVCNEETIDATYITEKSVLIGVAGLTLDGSPVHHPRYKKFTRISANGTVTSESSPTPARLKPLPSLAGWLVAPTDEFVDGSSDRFAGIDGPASMQQIGAGSGYGWMRIQFRPAPGKTARAEMFESADRLHLYLDGEWLGLHGIGPGAEEGPLSMPLKEKSHTLTALVDNLGRTSEGNAMGEPKGIFGHIWHCSALRAGSPKLEADDPVDMLEFRSPIFGLEDGDLTDGRRITWKLHHRRKTPVVMVIDADVDRGIVLVNGTPVAVLARGARHRLVLAPELLGRGQGLVQVAVVSGVERALDACREGVRFFEYEQNLTAKASWGFAKWEPPAASKYKPAAGKAGASARGRPAWWKTKFTLEAVDGPVFLDATGLSKGQLYINGHNAGRYFVATRTGKAVPPQTRYYLPEPWLKAGATNDLLLFDEHGFSPERARLVRA